MGKISAPEPITPGHSVDSFDCGIPTLNDWLKRRALKNEASGASRTFVVCRNGEVIGYYALATGSVEHQAAPKKLRRNMPDPIPVMILGRLAVDARCRHLGVGRGLLKDAVLRCLAVSKQVGVRALLVHALTDDAKNFYLRFGFLESPLDPMTLALPFPKFGSEHSFR